MSQVFPRSIIQRLQLNANNLDRTYLIRAIFDQVADHVGASAKMLVFHAEFVCPGPQQGLDLVLVPGVDELASKFEVGEDRGKSPPQFNFTFCLFLENSTKKSINCEKTRQTGRPAWVRSPAARL